MFVDSHCHLADDKLYQKLEYYLDEMNKNKIVRALSVATNPQDQLRVLNLIEDYDFIYGSAGIHPETVLPKDFIFSTQYLYQLAQKEKIIAIGETGLDYYRLNLTTNKRDIKNQQARFIQHLEVAVTLDLPVIIHTRGNSYNDLLAIMKDYKIKKAIMHCFTESIEVAKQCLDLGYYISISGIVTFKNANQVQQVASYIPIDNLLIETDAPFLAPTPYRGQVNHPALLIYTAKFIANLRHVDVETIAISTYNNFNNLFKID